MTSAKISVLTREVAPFLASLAILALAALAADALLHLSGAVWVGRYLGIPGVLLILGSFGYSLRKHKLIARGNPVKLLRRHEYMAWAGSLLVLVHAGIHFNAVLAWLATLAMVINILSGLTGKFLLARARKRMESTRQAWLAQGKDPDEIAGLMHWDSLTYGAVKQWRVVHVPITLAFSVSALGHIIAVFLFWGWK
jgi:UPF0716 family protein affecting phage T7 exclusion